MTIQLTSNSNYRLAFKTMNTSPSKYCVRPSSGIIEPNAVKEIQIILQSQREPPACYSDCKDKFLVKCMRIDSSVKDIKHDLHGIFAFAKHEAINMTKIRVVMIPPAKHALETLFQAIKEVNLNYTELLLRHGVDANAVDEHGFTALMAAAMGGRADCLDLLLKHGADVNATTRRRATAMMWAVLEGHADCLDLLLKHGADVNAATEDEKTALMMAAGGGYVDCLKLLMKHGGNMNATNADGDTALTLAAKEGRVDCLELLLKRGANLDDDKIKEALDIIAKKHGECEKILQGHMYRSEQELIDSEQARHQMETLALDSSASTIPSPSAPFMTVAPVPTHDARKDFSHQNWVISFEDLQLGNLIGKGSYAEVYRATWHGTEVAAKLFTLPGGSTDSQAEFSTSLLNKITDEADLLAAIRHPNVVAFLAMCPDPPCMVTELCSGGSLFGLMKRCKNDPDLAAKLTWGRRLSMLIDVAAGISHLHQRKPPILHRDLKSPNVLVDLGWKVKIADLGLSKLLEEVTTETHAGSTASSMNPRWTAPEVFETGNWLPAGDVYSFGVVMWELLTWELPWTHVNQFQVSHKLPKSDICYSFIMSSFFLLLQMLAAILRGDSLPLPERSAVPGPQPLSQTTFDRYVQLMKKCMDMNPSRRPNFPDVAAKLRELAVNESMDPAHDHDTTPGGGKRWGRTTSISSRNPSTGVMECGICLSHMGGDEAKSMAAPPCGHIYCFDCLIQIERNVGGNCPTCRQSYSEDEIKRVYIP